jgi:alpha-1,2-mannosyltransferase
MALSNMNERSWARAFVMLVAVLIAITATKTIVKALKPSRLGDQSRTAFLRWRSQVDGLLAGQDVYRAHHYPNPPMMGLILAPLMKLPPIVGLMTWFALKTVMAAWMIHLAMRWLWPNARPPRWRMIAAVAVALSLHPILGDLSHGNVNLLIGWLVFVGLDFYRRDRDATAGLVIALAIVGKVTPALFIPYFIWKRSWRAIAGLATGLVLWGLLVPGAILGFQHTTVLTASWYDTMVRPFVIDGMVTSEHPNQSLPGLLQRLFTTQGSFMAYDDVAAETYTVASHTLMDLGADTTRHIHQAVLAVIAIISALLIRRRRVGSDEGQRFVAEVSVIVLAMLLFSERTWKHHAVMLILPTLVLAVTALTTPWARWVLITVALLTWGPSILPEAVQDLALVYGSYTAAYAILISGMFRVLLTDMDKTPIEPPEHPKASIFQSRMTLPDAPLIDTVANSDSIFLGDSTSDVVPRL